MTAIAVPSELKPSDYSMDEALQLANTIRTQVQWGVFASLGASDMSAFNNLPAFRADGTQRDEYPRYGLTFIARILPFRADGTRGEGARKMQVSVGLNFWDYYDITVAYVDRGETRIHAAAKDIDAGSLSRWLLALDYNGETAWNPRYVPVADQDAAA